MSYNLSKIKEFFSDPEIRKLLEDNEWDKIIESGYFDNEENGLNLTSFIIQKLHYPLFEEIEYILDYCFFKDPNLQKFDIPYGVNRIGHYSFCHCQNLTNITIPNSVTQIGWAAFWDCENLKDVYYQGTVEEWNKIDIEEDNDCLLNANIHFNS